MSVRCTIYDGRVRIVGTGRSSSIGIPEPLFHAIVSFMPEPPRMTAITIGNFDGVHLGHVRLVQAARSVVHPAGKVVVQSFDTHPFTILRPHAVPPRLTTFAQRECWLREAGADEVVALHPTKELLSQTPEQFIASIVKQLSPSFVVEGPDFHFGKGRAGTIETLHQLGGKFGFRTIVIDPVETALSDQSIVRASSSMIRWLLTQGRVRDARMLLGRPYELVSTVVCGDKRGREIGVPTVNLAPTECMLPADGIYSGMAVVERSDVRGQMSEIRSHASSSKGSERNARLTSDLRPLTSSFPAAISVGTKPTFGDHPRVCEAHLIGYSGPLDDYGWTLRLQFHDWLRDQVTYTSVDLLIDQLKRDIARARIQSSNGQNPNSRMPNLDFGLLKA
jgi:riboflavin kinase / FMN adenylyltransferase